MKKFNRWLKDWVKRTYIFWFKTQINEEYLEEAKEKARRYYPVNRIY